MTPCSTEVFVHLTVVDKSLPLFDRQFYSAEVAEDVVIHTVVSLYFNIHVPFGMKLYYTIVSGNEYELFDIDFSSGTYDHTRNSSHKEITDVACNIANTNLPLLQY